ncbi:MAG: carbohydrate ABC transporter permease [Candidatus Hydrogenedentota bacterium]|jgi:ABC-type glycerol-3-phosphate transport system permease component|uniref:N-Acetyl-D-glucosamine ABC transport system, permease protein 2 n=1 Tax=Sumerlaea chitinivorans TaxID=2250252 RepID=A0A2Z4Y6R7_SUMC1|nr:N-Acetyl-D-glucosamine ABC transport system, permease protein 2 [Candidatus Sumerlaea chitinivorans]MCX7963775.1 carbohydrate ABC transporter permease [Candidatus Sumerlaea chitinivorans]RMH25555.1 MAG: carbohydrate ABC transporter permease [Candidatus Hydrogenedentota bacterium]
MSEIAIATRPSGVGPLVGRAIRLVLIYALLFTGAIVFALPFLWMVRTALMDYAQVQQYPLVWIPNPVRWENFREALGFMDFPILLRNTLFITLFALTGQVLSCSIVAFGFARLEFPGREFLFMVLLSTMMLPAMVTEIPRFILFRHFGWIDTYLPLIVPAYFGSPFFIFLLRQFFKTIPKDLDEAARIDGCSSWRIYWQIMLPLCKPVLAVVVIFGFIWTWNDFWGPLVYLRTADKKTLSLGLQVFQGVYQTYYHYLMAASLVVLAPVLALYVFCQRYFTQGIVMTGMKG